MIVQFWGTQGDYGALSNFSRHKVVINHKRYPTTEHYYQSQKFATTDPLYANKIAKASLPRDAAKLGRSKNKRFLRSDWELVKLDIMRVALRAKIDQHPDIKELLLSTGEARIEETSPTDFFWGTGRDGSGENWLGRLWMELRDELRGKKPQGKKPPKNKKPATPPETNEEFMAKLIADFPDQE